MWKYETWEYEYVKCSKNILIILKIFHLIFINILYIHIYIYLTLYISTHLDTWSAIGDLKVYFEINKLISKCQTNVITRSHKQTSVRKNVTKMLNILFSNAWLCHLTQTDLFVAFPNKNLIQLANPVRVHRTVTYLN